MMKRVWAFVILLALCLCGCNEAAGGETTLPTGTTIPQAPSETTQPVTVPPTTQPPQTQPTTQPTEPEVTMPPVPTGPIHAPVAEIDVPGIGTLYTDPDPGRICIAVFPTWAYDRHYYIIPENQEAFFSAYLEATRQLDTTKREEIPGYSGWEIEYRGTSLQANTDGTFCVNYEFFTYQDASEQLFALGTQALRDTGIGEPVKPEELTGIRKATLQWNGTYTVTDSVILEKMEALFAQSSEPFGATKCFFSGILTLELENGETKTIAMASDGCCVWMSEGAFYDYDRSGNSNIIFYKLFTPPLIREASWSGIDQVLTWFPYLDWEIYGAYYGEEAAFNLMRQFYNWVKEDPQPKRMQDFMFAQQGLSEPYAERFAQWMLELFELHPENFARACMSISDGVIREYIKDLLAEAWGIPNNEVTKKLYALIPD